MALILGIDPGSYVTGFGCIYIKDNQLQHVSHGIIKLPKEALLAERLRELSEGLKEIFKKYKPHHVVVEKIFLGKNADSAFKLGHARGVAMSEAAQSGAQVYEYATRVIKKGIAGKGSADKEQVQTVLMYLLKLSKIESLDASDALALAVYHAQGLAIEKRLNKSLKGVDL